MFDEGVFRYPRKHVEKPPKAALPDRCV